MCFVTNKETPLIASYRGGEVHAETIKAVTQPTSDTSYFRKATTKLYKEADKIYYTIWKYFYDIYKTPEQFKSELSELIQYTVKGTNRYIKEITVAKAAMQKFTEKHATDKITMPKFEDKEGK